MTISSDATKELFRAARNNDCEACRNLVAVGGSLEAKDIVGNTPLHIAVLTNKFDVAATMIKLGANPNARNDTQHTTLHYATTAEMVRLLVEAKAYLEMGNNEGSTPLITSPNIQVTAELLRLGADINAQNNDGITPLIRATVLMREDTIKTLITHGADISITTKEGANAITFCDAQPNLVHIKERLIQEHTRRTTEAFEKAARQGTPKRRKIIRPPIKNGGLS
ncbi:MAG: hypothetical protein OXT65_10695 [Alphaproteobacteria bacterium]|nr:hypothetical protein [Alphaproteobacteria bacterium]